MKRFWDAASVTLAAGGYSVRLDGKVLHLPGGAVLVTPSATLADALAAEWQAAGGQKGGEMSFSDTPLTQLAGTAQLRIAPDPEPTVAALLRYAENDLLCYRAESPPALARRQATEWQPWLDWLALTYDAPLMAGSGIRHMPQSDTALAALYHLVAAYSPSTLAGLGVAVPALGSLVLGLALAEGRIDAGAAHATASLDELFQAELWGRDAEAERRRSRIGEEIALATRFMRLASSQSISGSN